MALTSHLLIYLFAIITLASCQSVYSLNSTDKRSPTQEKKALTDPPIDSHYLDGCTAILKGFDDVLSSEGSYSYYFAEWENKNPDRTLLDYFDNSKGLISKIFVKNDSKDDDDSWILSLLIYDGVSINKKAASLQIEIDNVQNNLTLNQTNGTFTTSNNRTLTVYYGENFEDKSQTDVTGQVAISFIDTAMNQPFSSFDRRATSVQGYSFRLSFISSDGSFSFETSVFDSSFMTTADNLITCAIAVVSLLVGLSSWYTEGLNKKLVVFATVPAFGASASYIFFWSLFEPRYSGLAYFILVIPQVVNMVKFVIWYFKKMNILDQERELSNSQYMIMFASYMISFSPLWFSTVWLNLLPSFVLLFQLGQKMWTFKQNLPCLTRFEVMNSLSVLLWMGYAYLYPRNFYRFSNTTLVYLSFGCIFFQLVCLAVMQIIVNKRSNQQSALLLEDESMHHQQTNDQRANHSQSQDLEEETSTHHRYTLYAKIDEYHELVKKECFCKKSLIGAKPKSLYKTPCGHVFHEDCLREYGAKRMKCPSCEKKLPEFETTKQ